MKKISGIVMLILTSCVSIAFAQSFPDIEGHQYQDSIEFLRARDIVQGFPDGTFGPNRGITRAEMLKIILGATKAKLGGDRTDCFSDVHDERYAQYVCYAREQKIIRGYGDGTFKPDQQITIAEGLKIALNSFDAGVTEAKGNRRYEPFVDFVHQNNVFSKYAIFPQGTMTRGQMSYLVHQLVLEKEGDIKFTGIRSNKSLGCGEHPPSDELSSVNVGGMERHFITALPRGYNEDKQYKLIVAFHGRTNPNTMVREYYKIEKEAGKNAIVVYPAGLPEEGPSRNRSDGGDKNDKLRDFAFFDAIVEKFEQDYCIDQDEIYVIGHSLGGWFTDTVGCARGDIIRGIGSVGGSITTNKCTGPVAAMIMHNPKDNLAGYGGGVAARNRLLKANSCGPTTVEYDSPEEAHCVEYTDCQDGAPVVRCPHTVDEERGTYYPHTRPNFAGNLIWDFWNHLK